MPTPGPIVVDLLDAATSTGPAPAAEVCALVNDVYAVAEEGLWCAGRERTTTEAITELIAAGEVLAARTPDGRIVGSVWCHDVAAGTSEFGMLVAAPDRRGLGIGRALVDEVERRSRDRGLVAVQLELLVPVGWRHPAKELLAAWYGRRGYRVAHTTAMAEAYPHLAPFLATPCDLQLRRKDLR